jgi:hypothetical protein
MLLDFLSTTYAAAAETGGWDRAHWNAPSVFRRRYVSSCLLALERSVGGRPLTSRLPC